MLKTADVYDALNTLSDPAKLRQAIVGLQTNHSPKHLTVTHVRPNAAGFGSAFFMKKALRVQPITTTTWGKTSTRQGTVAGDFSEEFGDYTDIDRTDEAKIIAHLRDSTSVAYGLNANNNPKRLILFTDVPDPYVGFDWVANKCLPVAAGYLAIVFEKVHTGWKIITAFPCTRAYYQRFAPTVIHKN